MTGATFNGVSREIIMRLFGPPPAWASRPPKDPMQAVFYYAEKRWFDVMRPVRPEFWVEDLPHLGLVFLYRYLAAEFARRGGDEAAADSLRRDLQTGVIVVVALSPDGMESTRVDPRRFCGADSSGLFWGGSYPEGLPPNLYVFVGLPDEATDAAWRPSKEIKLTAWCALGGVAEQAAERRLKQRGERISVGTTCNELADMWNASGRDPTTGNSIYTIRHRQKAAK